MISYFFLIGNDLRWQAGSYFLFHKLVGQVEHSKSDSLAYYYKLKNMSFVLHVTFHLKHVIIILFFSGQLESRSQTEYDLKLFTPTIYNMHFYHQFMIVEKLNSIIHS